jgi:PKD repeat protein
VPPFNQYFIGAASGLQGKTITKTRWTFGDLTPSIEVSVSGAGFYPVQHNYNTSGIYITKFEAYDSHGLHNSATRIINIASGIPTVIVTISGQPRSGNAALIVDFDTKIESTPPGVSISTQLLLFDDGQTSIAFNPTHAYTEPGIYKPIFTVRDSRGFHWSDSLEAGPDS